MLFATLRLGKSSVKDILEINSLPAGTQANPFSFATSCTQVPTDFEVGSYAFLWLGSDNSKGQATEWRQGFRAIARVTNLERGEEWNAESTISLSVGYVFPHSVGRKDFLRNAALAYYWCCDAPLIGVDDRANQTVRIIENQELSSVEAMLYGFAACNGVDRQKLSETYPELRTLLNYAPKVLTGANSDTSALRQSASDKPRNLIYFGAPGTGKSFQLNMNAESNFNGVDANGISKVQRVTLHPRYSYFHFVGSYKPVTRHSDTYVNGEIVYEFVPGPIMECLVHALNSPDDDYLLILEEINRSETAAVFGDFFQLLDRKEDGTSAYPITVGTDVVQYLNNALTDSGKMTLRNLGGEINDLSNNGKILLPGNLHLWATMNSADQGVFPLDSAFKRRWSFRYVGIDDGAEHCPWNKERTLLNALLRVHAHCNEDKLIGPFFLPISIEPRLDDGTINPEFSETFANKVLMYLVEDVAKYSMNEIVDTKLLPLAPVLSDYLSAWRQDNFGIFAGIDSWNGFDSTSRAAGEIESEEDTLTNDPMSIG